MSIESEIGIGRRALTHTDTHTQKGSKVPVHFRIIHDSLHCDLPFRYSEFLDRIWL